MRKLITMMVLMLCSVAVAQAQSAKYMSDPIDYKNLSVPEIPKDVPQDFINRAEKFHFDRRVSSTYSRRTIEKPPAPPKEGFSLGGVRPLGDFFCSFRFGREL